MLLYILEIVSYKKKRMCDITQRKKDKEIFSGHPPNC